MSIKKRFQIKLKQKKKRLKRRKKLKKKDINPDDIFYSGIYLGKKGN
jgi:hypothetical protein